MDIMKNIYLLRDKYGASIHFVKGENENDVAKKFLYHQYRNVDSIPEKTKERYIIEILENFEITLLGNFDNDICETSIYSNVTYEDSNEVELIINKENKL
jgi:hypothetical protein